MKNWIEKNNIIYCSVISNNMSGKEWVAYLESKKIVIDKYARRILLSKNFKPTSGITYGIAIIKGEKFNCVGRVSKNIRNEAKNCKFATPDLEIACLIAEKISNKEFGDIDLGLIVIMHEPVKDPKSRLLMLGYSNRHYHLYADYGDPDFSWNRHNGFAFISASVQVKEIEVL